MTGSGVGDAPAGGEARRGERSVEQPSHHEPQRDSALGDAPCTAAKRVRVVALIGLPGAGKSTLAAGLARTLGLRVLSRDAIRAAMFPRCRYSLAEKKAALRALLTGIEVNCALGESSVLDGMTFARRADLERVAAVVAEAGAALVPIWLDLPPHVARARIAADRAAGTHPAEDRDESLVEAVLERFETPDAGTAVIDAGLPPDDVLERVVAIVVCGDGAERK